MLLTIVFTLFFCFYSKHIALFSLICDDFYQIALFFRQRRVARRYLSRVHTNHKNSCYTSKIKKKHQKLWVTGNCHEKRLGFHLKWKPRSHSRICSAHFWPHLHGNDLGQKRQLSFADAPFVYTKTTKTIAKTHKNENALQSGNFENVFKSTVSFPRVNRENATKTHTCFSKYAQRHFLLTEIVSLVSLKLKNIIVS